MSSECQKKSLPKSEVAKTVIFTSVNRKRLLICMPVGSHSVCLPFDFNFLMASLVSLLGVLRLPNRLVAVKKPV